MYEYNALITRVYDGDTVTCDIDLGFGIWMKKQKIRLSYIDTPEIRGEERPDGLIARDFLAGLILNEYVVLRTEQDKTGKYGRWLGEIFVDASDEKSVNTLLLEAGLAEEYK